MDAETLTRRLRGHWHGSYGTALCPAHDNRRTPALSLSNGADGRLLLKCHVGCAFLDILDAIRPLGLEPGGGAGLEANSHAAEQAAAREGAKRRKQARACWAETVPIDGTLAEAYLRRRGIAVPLPPVLRFHPSCWHASARRLPAMVAKVERGGRGVAVHRTYLGPAGGKADVKPPRAMLGPCQGGAVRLSTGPGPLILAEGIETALSLLDGLGAYRPRIWAALSTSGIRGLDLPPDPGELYLAPDGDGAGRAAAEALAIRAVGTGWRVRLMPAPDGRDWNDIGQDTAA